MQMIELLEKDIKAAFTKHYVKKSRVKHYVLMKGIEDTPLSKGKMSQSWWWYIHTISEKKIHWMMLIAYQTT